MPGLDLATDGRDWPHRELSRQVQGGGLRWHVQERPGVDAEGRRVLLLHGTGASTHSFAGLISAWAAADHLFAIDLPGHGFTQAPASAQLSLPAMSGLVARLCEEVDFQADVIVGHSAGAAIALNMTLDGLMEPEAIISLAGALMPLGGSNSGLFSLAAKMLWLNPVIPRVFAWRAGNPSVVADLLRRTGSTVEGTGLTCYQTLASDPAHAAAALGMMANWNLSPLNRKLPDLVCRLLLISGERDGMIPLGDADQVKALAPGAESIVMPGLGHLAHEEDPAAVSKAIVKFLARTEG